MISVISIIWLMLAGPVVDIIRLKKNPKPDVGVGDILIQ